CTVGADNGHQTARLDHKGDIANSVYMPAADVKAVHTENLAHLDSSAEPGCSVCVKSPSVPCAPEPFVSSVPRYASKTASFRATSAGCPDAIVSPKLSTMIRSHVSSIMRTLCSITKTASPPDPSSRISRVNCAASTRFIPAAGSSRTKTLGRAAKALAISSLRWSPYDNSI